MKFQCVNSSLRDEVWSRERGRASNEWDHTQSPDLCTHLFGQMLEQVPLVRPGRGSEGSSPIHHAITTWHFFRLQISEDETKAEKKRAGRGRLCTT